MYNDIDKLFSIYDIQIKKIFISKENKESKLNKIQQLLDKLYNLIVDRL